MEIDSLDHNIKTIKTAIRDQSNPMKVGDGDGSLLTPCPQLAETRLDQRVARPNLEQCADQANGKLATEVRIIIVIIIIIIIIIDQVTTLHDTLSALTEKLAQCQEVRAELVTNRAALHQVTSFIHSCWPY